MPHFRRSIFLIDKPFQIRFSFYVCSWLFALSIVYPLIIYNLFNYFLRYMSLDPTGPSLTSLQQIKQEIVWLLILFQAVFLLVTFLISIFISHRIAGPLYKLRNYFADAKNGQFGRELHFRKKDHFHDLAGEYNDMVSAIKERFDGTKKALGLAIEQLEKSKDKSPDTAAALTSLKEARERLPS